VPLKFYDSGPITGYFGGAALNIQTNFVHNDGKCTTTYNAQGTGFISVRGNITGDVSAGETPEIKLVLAAVPQTLDSYSISCPEGSYSGQTSMWPVLFGVAHQMGQSGSAEGIIIDGWNYVGGEVFARKTFDNVPYDTGTLVGPLTETTRLVLKEKPAQ